MSFGRASTLLPGGFQDHQKRSQGSVRGQHGSRETSQRPPRSGQKSAGGPQEAPKSTQEEPKMVPWPPRSPQEIPKGTPEELRRPPRDPQERPKEAQESPKTLSRPSSDRKRRFFRNRAPAEAKSWFLRVRGSAWEVKIDPKRVEKEYKHVLEEDMSQRRCQESRKKLRRSPKVPIHWPC